MRDFTGENLLFAWISEDHQDGFLIHVSPVRVGPGALDLSLGLLKIRFFHQFFEPVIRTNTVKQSICCYAGSQFLHFATSELSPRKARARWARDRPRRKVSAYCCLKASEMFSVQGPLKVMVRKPNDHVSARKFLQR